MSVEKAFLDTRIVAMIRGVSGEDVDNIVEALIDGGIKLLEITLNSPDAYNSISHVCKKYGDRIHVGAGTVLNRKMVVDSITAGAEFIVTPTTDMDVIQYCAGHDILVMPGAFTPTEIQHAVEWGAKYVKVFPIGTYGSQYLRDLLAPLNTVKLIAVGGVNVDNAAEYKEAGAFGLGVGGGLCKVPADKNFKRITENARQLIQTFSSCC